MRTSDAVSSLAMAVEVAWLILFVASISPVKFV
jgi:hypothetical protein